MSAAGQLIIGVDPGLSGAIACITADRGVIVWCEDMPVAGGAVVAPLVARLLDESSVEAVVVEEVAAFPKNGSIGNFKLGRSFGVILGAVGDRHRLELVRPAAWKRAMGLTADKEWSRAAALQRWPERAELFARKRDDGRAEACLLAEWWRTKGAGR